MIKKGKQKFLVDRIKRLGIPFIVGVSLLIPIAYFPSFYLNNHNFDISLFIKDFLQNQKWPVGPPWFIWILLLFNAIAVIIPEKLYTSISKATSVLSQNKTRFLITILFFVSLAFIPISLWVGQYKWTGFGPFDFQVNRLLLYFIFFIFGTSIGSGNWENYFFINNKLLNKSWQFWLVLCLISYLFVELITYNVWDFVKAGNLGVNVAWAIFDLLFVTSCISSSIAFVSVFKQNIHRQFKLWTNLSANAFGIYLIHYTFIVWLQYALLNISLPVFIKFLIVFLVTLLASWTLINFLRKFKIINQII